MQDIIDAFRTLIELVHTDNEYYNHKVVDLLWQARELFQQEQGEKELEVDATEKCLIRSGEQILAIKHYKNRTFCTLKDSKKMCDRFRDALEKE